MHFDPWYQSGNSECEKEHIAMEFFISIEWMLALVDLTKL